MFTPTTHLRAAFACLCTALAACTDPATQPSAPAGTAPHGDLPAAVSGWTTRANLPGIERTGVTTAVVRNASRQSVLYAIGGSPLMSAASLGKVHAYNAATNTWSTRASIPIPVYSTNGAGVIDGRIYVSGGVTGDKLFRRELQVYDPATDTWTLKASMPDGVTWGGVTGVFGGKLYVLTSVSEEDAYTEFAPLRLYRYDPAADQWTRLASSPPQQRAPMGGFIGGKLYVTGEIPSGFGGGALLHAYDPATDRWSSKRPLPRARFGGAGVALGGKLYVIGGLQVDPDGIRPVRTTSVYDPVTDRWNRLEPIPTFHGGAQAARIVREGVPRIAVVGGSRPGNNLEFTP